MKRSRMCNKNQQIKALKKVFDEAKYAQRREDGGLSDIDLFGELDSALTVVGKECLNELKDEVYRYVRDPYPMLRAEAVRTLGWNSRLGIDEFCLNGAPKIWLDDPDEEVRIAALAAWASYYSRSKELEVLRALYDILRFHQYSILTRSWALGEFFSVSDSWVNKLEEHNKSIEMGEKVEDHDKFDKMVDWDHVHRVMQEWVPGWSLANTKI